MVVGSKGDIAQQMQKHDPNLHHAAAIREGCV